MKIIIQDIKSILALARKQTYQAINSQMVKAYWLVGQRIVEEEQGGNEKATYGDKLLQNLSKALSVDLGKGFSLANLKNFRKFYLTYPDFEKSYALRSQLSWTHHRMIMRVENERARAYYIETCENEQWSTRTLERHIRTKHFERLLSTSPLETHTEEKINKHEFIKDPHVFEFLKIPQTEHESEQTTEGLIITDLQKFMLELGKGFSFVGRQFRISTETSHYYIDLVFYNYILKCFVLRLVLSSAPTKTKPSSSTPCSMAMSNSLQVNI